MAKEQAKPESKETPRDETKHSLGFLKAAVRAKEGRKATRKSSR